MQVLLLFSTVLSHTTAFKVPAVHILVCRCIVSTPLEEENENGRNVDSTSLYQSVNCYVINYYNGDVSSF
jgi:hypothetical protein